MIAFYTKNNNINFDLQILNISSFNIQPVRNCSFQHSYTFSLVEDLVYENQNRLLPIRLVFLSIVYQSIYYSLYFIGFIAITFRLDQMKQLRQLIQQWP